MSDASATEQEMSAVLFYEYGEPEVVLRMERKSVPEPDPGQIRIRVLACSLNPADWAICEGLFGGALPRGVGFDVSGQVEAVAEGVGDVAVGDMVFGVPDWANRETSGLAEHAVLTNWASIPSGLDPVEAAALPMVVETTVRSLDLLGVTGDSTLLVHGAGTMVGFAAVQVARMRGARVIATAGETFAEELGAFGAAVTGYSDGMAERVRELAGASPDMVLDTSPPGRGILPTLIAIADGDPKRVLTITDHEEAKKLGVRASVGEAGTVRYDALAPFATLAANGKFSLPIAQTFPFSEWRKAVDLSRGRSAHGKVLVRVSDS